MRGWWSRTFVGVGPAVAAAIATAPFPPVLEAQCTDRGPAAPFGPRPSAADAGRMYTYLLTPDGRDLYFFKRVGTAPEDYRIFRSVQTNAGWGTPEPVPLDGDHSDLYPAISADGTRLVFASYRPVPGDTSSKPNAHLWMARREGSVWGRPELVAASRLGHYHSGLKLDTVGTLRFHLTTPDWKDRRAAELRWTVDRFEPSLRSGTEPAAEYWQQRTGDSLFIWGSTPGPNGLSLVAASEVTQPGGRRMPAQYYLTYSRGGAWTPLVKAGGGLGEGAPNFAWFSRDGCYVHYTQDYSEFIRVPVERLVPPR